MEVKRKKVIDLYLAGKSQRKIVSELKQLEVNKMFVHRTIKRYKETGSIAKRFGGGRKKAATTKEEIQKIRHRLQTDPNCSARRISAELGLSRQRVQDILKNELGLTAQKFQKIKDYKPKQNRTRMTRIKELTPEYGSSAENTSTANNESNSC